MNDRSLNNQVLDSHYRQVGWFLALGLALACVFLSISANAGA